MFFLGQRLYLARQIFTSVVLITLLSFFGYRPNSFSEDELIPRRNYSLSVVSRLLRRESSTRVPKYYVKLTLRQARATEVSIVVTSVDGRKSDDGSRLSWSLSVFRSMFSTLFWAFFQCTAPMTSFLGFNIFLNILSWTDHFKFCHSWLPFFR